MSRAPLAENSVNQPARSPHKSRRPQTRPLEGRDLKEWQREWRKIMHSTVFYFDSVDAGAVDRVRPVLEELSSRVAAFFENTVTIVVTRRAVPERGAGGDVLVKAQNAGMKVWTYDKLVRFLTNLYGRSPFARGDKADRLSALLQEEKLIGPADRDPTARRDDYHYFRAEYLLVWDVAHKYKPTVIKDYHTDAAWWPQLRVTAAGRSPFVCDVPAKRADDTPEEPAKRKREPQPPAAVKRQATEELCRQVHDVAASGIQRSASTSATRSVVQSGEPGQLPQFASREMANLKRKVLGRPAVAEPVVAPVPAAPPKKDRKSDRMTGYCENCNERYEKFADHVRSRRHLAFANDDSNFADLDALITSLPRF